LGAGAIQSNMPVFGNEQNDELQSTSRYFNRHVFVVGIAAASSKLLISYIADKDPTKLYTGYITAAMMLLISIILFTIRRRFYLHVKPYDSIVTKLFPVIKNACRIWLENRTKNINLQISEQRERDIARTSIEFLDFAKIINNGKYSDRIVDDVKSFRRLLIVFSLLIPYWIIYDQVKHKLNQIFFNFFPFIGLY